MRVGLLTIHNSVNPGAALQASGLYSAIEKLGHEVSVIDYCPDYFPSRTEPLKRLRLQGAKGLIKAVVLGNRIEAKADKFNSYAADFYPEKTKRYCDYQSLCEEPPQFDAAICGSDQIWNPSHVLYDESWLFGYYRQEKPLLISYAASIGKDELEARDLDWLQQGVSRFDSVGVREDTAVDVLRDLGIAAVQNADPTFLHDAAWWRHQEKKPDYNLPEKFILYYPLQPNPIESGLVERASADFGVPVVSPWSALRKLPGIDIQIPIFGPQEFLWLLDNAEAVVTNSFHGLAFSAIFRKRLISFKNLTRNSRLASLFRTLRLDEYQISSIEEYKSTNWDEKFASFFSALERIEPLKRASLDYLAETLGDRR